MMKRIFSTLIFTLFGFGLFAQADTIFVIGAEFGVVTVVDDSTFQVSSEHPADQLGQGFLPTQIQVGYQLFDINGRLFRVSSIVSANFGESVMQVVELQDNNIGPVGVGVVYRKPDNSDCVPIIPQGNTGLSPAIVAKIHNHNAVVGCGGTGGGGDPGLADSMLVVRDSLAAIRGDIGTGGGGSGTVETITSSDGNLSFDATDPANIIATNNAPDQTVTFTNVGSTAITGTYPNFTATGSGLTGSALTTQFIPKYEGTSLVNSVIREGSATIGINTSPATGRQLHIHNPSSAVTYAMLTNNVTGTGPNDGFQFVMVNSTISLINREAGGMDFRVSDTNAFMKAKSTGEVSLTGSDALYKFDVGVTGEAIRIPNTTTATRKIGRFGYLSANTTTGAYDLHNGTSFGRLYPDSDVTPGNGEVRVFNSTTGLYVPTTLSLLSTAQTNYQIDVSENPAGTNFRTVYGGDSEAAIGVTQDGADAAIVELSVYNSTSGATTALTLSESEASLEANVARVKGTDVVINSNLSDITAIAIGSGFKQTGFVIDDTSAIRVIATTAPNFAGVQYPATINPLKFNDLSLTHKGYVDNLFAQGFQGSILLPDSLVSILTSDGAGIEFSGDYVNLVGTEVLANGQVIPMNDTLVVPVYCHPHGEAAATGNDYRGWRVPPDLDGARLIGVHYSFDTPGSDTAIIQIGNGAVNVFGGTIPATGFVNVTASRVLVENEKWTPSIGTLNGTGHEGLMLNLIIERNR
jgi:hypothetical protein